MAATETAPQADPAKPNHTMHCSFCGKSQHEVKKLIAGPAVFICDHCVGLCDKILAAETQADAKKAAPEANPDITKPEQMATDRLLALLASAETTFERVGEQVQRLARSRGELGRYRQGARRLAPGRLATLHLGRHTVW